MRPKGHITRADIETAKLGSLFGVLHREEAQRALSKRLCSPGDNVSDDAIEAGLENARDLKALFSIVREIIEFRGSGKPVSGRLSVKDGALVHTRFWPMESRFRVPTMLFDATLPPKAVIERALGRKVEILPPIEVRHGEHARFHYLIGASWSATAIGTVEGKGTAATGIRNVERARSFIALKSLEHDSDTLLARTDLAVFAQKKVLARLYSVGFSHVRIGWRPRLNVKIAQFGALRGLNAYKGVRALIMFGRQLPKVEVVEGMAERVSGVPLDPKLCGRWRKVDRKIDTRDGRAVVIRHIEHSDPLCEAIRESICEHELIQAVGRGRAIRRTADKPLDVYIVGNVPLPFLADSIKKWSDVSAAGWQGELAGRPVFHSIADAITAGRVAKRRAAERIIDSDRKGVALGLAVLHFSYHRDGSVREFSLNRNLTRATWRQKVRLLVGNGPGGVVGIGDGGTLVQHRVFRR